MGLQDQIEAAVESHEWGIASAVKRGRNPKFPYVPIVEYRDRTRTHNPARREAYATRDEAVSRAQQCIDHLKSTIKAQLAEPRYRALREQYGLPREII
jgi:hypothetical protein